MASLDSSSREGFPGRGVRSKAGVRTKQRYRSTSSTQESAVDQKYTTLEWGVSRACVEDKHAGSSRMDRKQLGGV